MTTERITAYNNIRAANLEYSIAVEDEAAARRLASTRTVMYYTIAATQARKVVAAKLETLIYYQAANDALVTEDAAADAAALDAGWNC
jgi:hypothetical protein